MRVLPMGPTAVLVDELRHDPAAWAQGVRHLRAAGLVDVVPAARTVLIVCDAAESLAHLLDRVHEVRPIAPSNITDEPLSIPVDYDGDDLHGVAEHARLEPAEVIRLHTAPTYEVAFCGFAAGFGYLRGLDHRLHVPRHATPRTKVPAGSVAIASEFTAVYPRETPGGWHLLGTTSLVMFDPDRTPPALLVPGRRVRFVAA